MTYLHLEVGTVGCKRASLVTNDSADSNAAGLPIDTKEAEIVAHVDVFDGTQQHPAATLRSCFCAHVSTR